MAGSSVEPSSIFEMSWATACDSPARTRLIRSAVWFIRLLQPPLRRPDNIMFTLSIVVTVLGDVDGLGWLVEAWVTAPAVHRGS